MLVKKFKKQVIGAGFLSTRKGVVGYEILAGPVERYTRERKIPRDELLTATKRFPHFDR